MSAPEYIHALTRQVATLRDALDLGLTAIGLLRDGIDPAKVTQAEVEWRRALADTATVAAERDARLVKPYVDALREIENMLMASRPDANQMTLLDAAKEQLSRTSVRTAPRRWA